MKKGAKRSDRSDLTVKADKVVQDLAKLAFASLTDFVRVDENNELQIDEVKATEAGAIVVITNRTVGRGKNSKQVRRVKIKMPNKQKALVTLGKHVGLFKRRSKRK